MSDVAAATDCKSKADRRPKARLLTLDDLDARTTAARRAFELRDKVVSERGGPESMGTVRFLMASGFATVSAMIDDMSTRWFRGEPIDAAGLATLMNVRRRDAELIGIDPEPKDITPDLSAYLQARASDEA